MPLHEAVDEKLASLIGHLIIVESQLVADIGLLIRVIETSLSPDYPYLRIAEPDLPESRVLALLEAVLPVKGDRLREMYARLGKAIRQHRMHGQAVEDFLGKLKHAIMSEDGAHAIRNLAAHGVWRQLTSMDVEACRARGIILDSNKAYYEVRDAQKQLKAIKNKALEDCDQNIITDGDLLMKATEELRVLRVDLVHVADIFRTAQHEVDCERFSI